jgi:hypothetical protein
MGDVLLIVLDGLLAWLFGNHVGRAVLGGLLFLAVAGVFCWWLAV